MRPDHAASAKDAAPMASAAVPLRPPRPSLTSTVSGGSGSWAGAAATTETSTTKPGRPDPKPPERVAAALVALEHPVAALPVEADMGAVGDIDMGIDDVAMVHPGRRKDRQHILPGQLMLTSGVSTGMSPSAVAPTCPATKTIVRPDRRQLPGNSSRTASARLWCFMAASWFISIGRPSAPLPEQTENIYWCG